MGIIYSQQGNDDLALKYRQQALNLHREVGDRRLVGYDLMLLGYTHFKLGNDSEASELYQQALALFKELEERRGELLVLRELGFFLEAQQQSELAIVFLKQSVNISEAIRQELRGRAQEEVQQAYTETVADTYRQLADLLLQQDRILEAQQVLDLLKVQELDEYLRGVRANEITQKGVVVLKSEQVILEQFDELQKSVIQLGQELAQLRQIPEARRSPDQQKRVAQLVQLQQDLNSDFNQFINSSAVQTALDQLSRTAPASSSGSCRFR